MVLHERGTEHRTQQDVTPSAHVKGMSGGCKFGAWRKM